jgi:outer membrane protein assembly factor BamB
MAAEILDGPNGHSVSLIRIRMLVIWIALISLATVGSFAGPAMARGRGAAHYGSLGHHARCVRHRRNRCMRHHRWHHRHRCVGRRRHKRHRCTRRHRHKHHHHPVSGPLMAPPVGTVLTTYEGRGRLNVIPGIDGSGSDGFSIVESVWGTTDESTITSFNVAGGELARLNPGSLTGECGAADISVPGAGRLLITMLVSTHAPEGLIPFSYSVALQAWDANTGRIVWSTTLVPQTAEPVPYNECQAYDGVLKAFSSTSDGRWGVELYGEMGAGGYVVNLATGAMRQDPHVLGTIGNYLVDETEAPSLVLIDPSSGATVGTLPAGQGYFTAPTLAPRGVFQNNVCTHGPPPAGVTSDGMKLVAMPASDYCSGSGKIVEYSLPNVNALWEVPESWHPVLAGDDGGVLVIKRWECTATETTCFVGLNDETGSQRWQDNLPEHNCNTYESCSELCGITAHQALLGISNGQRVVIDLATGTQLSYTEGGCGTILTGGIEVEFSEYNMLNAPQRIRVIQALSP